MTLHPMPRHSRHRGVRWGFQFVRSAVVLPGLVDTSRMVRVKIAEHHLTGGWGLVTDGIVELHIEGSVKNILSALHGDDRRIIARSTDNLVMTVYRPAKYSKAMQVIRDSVFSVFGVTGKLMGIAGKINTGISFVQRNKFAHVIIHDGPLHNKWTDRKIYNVVWDRDRATLNDIACVLREYVAKEGVPSKYGEGHTYEANGRTLGARTSLKWWEKIGR